MSLKNMEEALRVFSSGGLVIVTDDHDRENEGDLVMAASHSDAVKMAFIMRHTSGIVCAPMTNAKAKILGLDLMVNNNEDPHKTAFTVSVDARKGLTTGISAEQRSNTILALALSNNPQDLVRPGHVFPLIAKPGGVLERGGHTEASVDLCRLAGMQEVAVISELMNDDGSVMRGQQIRELASTYALPIISVSDIVEYRLKKENLLSINSQRMILTNFGAAEVIEFEDLYTGDHCTVSRFIESSGEMNVPIFLHVEENLSDIFSISNVVETGFQRISGTNGLFIYIRPNKQKLICESSQSRDIRINDWRMKGLVDQLLNAIGVNVNDGLNVQHINHFSLGEMRRELSLQ